jgi:hypothetical protein
MQMKRILGILLALCFLMSVTAAAVSARPDLKFGDKDDKKFGDKDDKKIEKKVVRTLKVVKKDDGIWILQLIKVTEESHHDKKVWFTTEWKFIPFHEDHDHR